MSDPSRAEEPCIVEWNGKSAGGFKRTPGSREEQRYVDIATRLLTNEVPQPPQRIYSTAGHPIWGMRLVAEGKDKPRYWCFSVQGRDEGREGEFGIAGTCRFGFLPGSLLPSQAWRIGVEKVAGGSSRSAGVLDDGQGHGAYEAPIRRALTGIAAGRNVRLEVPPTEAVTVIEAVLSVLPYDEAARRIWYTCLLEPLPRRRNRTIVAGDWPARFREADSQLFRRVMEELQDSPSGNGVSVLGDERLHGAFERVVQAATGGGPSSEMTAMRDRVSTLEKLLNELVLVRPPGVEDVSRLLDEDGGAERLESHPDVLRQWVRRYPQRTREWLLRQNRLGLRDCSAAANMMYWKLFEYQSKSTNNILGLPGPHDSGQAEWHTALAQWVVTAYPGMAERRALVESLKLDGGILGDPAWWQAAQPWLESIEVTSATIPELYPVTAKELARIIEQCGSLAPDVFRRLQGCPHPEQVLYDAAPSIRKLPASEIVDLLLLLAEPRPGRAPADWLQAQPLAVHLTEVTAECDPRAAAGWLAALFAGLQKHGSGSPSLQALLARSVDCLIRVVGPSPHDDAALRRVWGSFGPGVRPTRQIRQWLSSTPPQGDFGGGAALSFVSAPAPDGREATSGSQLQGRYVSPDSEPAHREPSQSSRCRLRPPAVDGPPFPSETAGTTYVAAKLGSWSGSFSQRWSRVKPWLRGSVFNSRQRPWGRLAIEAVACLALLGAGIVIGKSPIITGEGERIQAAASPSGVPANTQPSVSQQPSVPAPASAAPAAGTEAQNVIVRGREMCEFTMNSKDGLTFQRFQDNVGGGKCASVEPAKAVSIVVITEYQGDSKKGRPAFAFQLKESLDGSRGRGSERFSAMQVLAVGESASSAVPEGDVAVKVIFER